MRRLLPACAIGLLLSACDDTPAARDGATDIAQDTLTDATIDVASDATIDVAPPPPWPHELPAARVLGAPRGFTTARVIIHAHSVHSHDACDGNPYVDGGPNEPCLMDFRRAVCQTRQDVVFLTEHEARLSSVSIETALQHRDGDEEVREGGAVVGSWIRCADGHRVLILPGAENELMPIGLRRHPTPINGNLGAAYHADDAAGVARFREAGALVAIAHVEQRTIEHLRELSPDLVEVYNIHANIGPQIAPIASPDFNLGQALVDVLRFRNTESGLEPDLAWLPLFAENVNDLGKWAQAWSEGHTWPGIAGSDVHQNAIPAVLRDGERGDSYRRILRFFSNEVLVRGDINRANVMDALARGRTYVTFEALGEPIGFSCSARTRDGMDHEMGETVRMADEPVFALRAPMLHQPLPGVPAPRIHMVVYRADNDRWTMVQRWEDAPAMGDLRWTPPGAGTYRVEVRMLPSHARPYVPGMERYVRELPWIYGNPIRVM